MTDREIEDLILSVLKGAAPNAGFHDAQITFEHDWDGEPIIRVKAMYERRPIGPDRLSESVHRIRDRLIELGEQRFVFLTNEVDSERAAEPAETE